VINLEENNQKTGTKMNPMMIVAAIVVVAVLGIGAVVLAKPASNTEQTNTTANSDAMMEEDTMNEATGLTDETMMEEDAMMEDTKEFTLEAGSFYYKPNVITVKKGDKVKVTINSVDMMHNFVIDEFNVETKIAKSGESASVEFTADKAGSYEFYCSVASHRAQGMVGTLVVEE
jgi:nitrite reductase (NO-forming)